MANLNHIFNKEQIEEIEGQVGKSIYFTHLVTELVKQRGDDQTLSKILETNDTAFLRIQRQFENRLNKLFVHPLLGDLLYSEEIDFAVM